MKQFDIYAFDGLKERHFIITEIDSKSAIVTWAKAFKALFDRDDWSLYYNDGLIRRDIL